MSHSQSVNRNRKTEAVITDTKGGLMQIDNMKIWADNWNTDPKYTKKVNQRGGYTAIDAQYKLERVTKYFGACGIGWGFTRDFKLQGLDAYPATVHVVCDLLLWYKLPEDDTRYELPSMGGSELYHGKEGNYKADTDAWKKAETDALTKAFSRLGFFADVFLGMFDDEKYIEYLHDNPPEQGSLKAVGAPKPAITAAHAKACLDSALQLVPETESETQIVWEAGNCFKFAGLGERFMDRLCEAKGIELKGRDVCVWFWRRGTLILDAEIKAYFAAHGDPDADWMQHAKQVAQIALCELDDNIEAVVDPANLHLFLGGSHE